MNLNQLIADLSLAGVKLWVDGEELRVRAPKGVLTLERRDLLTLHKAELVSMLRSNNVSASDTDLPFVRVSREQHLPLSFAQQQMWVLSELAPNSPLYNVPLAVRLKGSLNVVALWQSFNEITQRHEALSTTFRKVNGQPIQAISSTLTITIPVVDLRGQSDREQEIQAQRLAQQEATRPFDLASDPMLRGLLLHLEEAEYILLLTMHHIAFDGWSANIFFRELAALYEAYCNDLPSPLPQLPIQYADFAHWQRGWLQGEVLESKLAYWKQQLQDAPTVLELPTDRPRSAVQPFPGATYSTVVPKKLTEALTILSQQEDVTLFMTLFTAFQILLYRYTGREDICTGTPIANRERAGIDGLIGNFLNTLVLRTKLEGNFSFAQLLAHVKEVALGAYAHQDLPFELLVEALQPARSLSHTPLCQVMFELENGHLSLFKLSGLTVSPLFVESGTAKFDLTLSLENTERGLIGLWEYNTDLFDAATIARMAEHFQTLLEGIVAHPEQKLSTLALLGADERHQILEEWNDTSADYVGSLCIHQLFEAQVERTPDAVALVFENEQLTYSELNARANQLAHYLQSMGVAPEVLVGLCMERSPEMVVGMLGILKAGGAYVPLDPIYPQQRVALILSEARVTLLLTQQKLVAQLPVNEASIICLDKDQQIIAQQSQQNLSSSVTANSLAYVLYTSGSTGRPKGVTIAHYSTVSLIAWAKQVYSPNQLAGVLAATSICFDLSVFELFVPLSWGGKVILAENALYLPTLLAANHVTLVNTVPSAIAELLRIDGIPDSVGTINLAGEPLQNKLVQQLYERKTVEKVFNLYGPSEDTTYSTFIQVQKLGKTKPPIGRPIANTQVYLLDDQLQPVPIGVLGELYISGDGLSRGYLNRPELTALKFLPSPFSDKLGARLYKTEDRARYLANGNIEFLGRIDNQVKLRGYRIELGEIEANISQHPHVRETVVIAREDVPGEKRLVAYIVADHKSAPTISDLRSFLKDKLPEYMVPIAIVMLDVLPLTPNGKVDRLALPAPEASRTHLREAYVCARTPVEEILVSLWAEILGQELVGIHDNFFDLGGHSLLGTQLMSRIRDVLQLELPLRSLFKAPTPGELAESIVQTHGDNTAAESSVIEPVARNGELPLSFAQARLWFLDQLVPGNPFYNMPFALRVTGKLDVSALQPSLNEIIRRHETLRTSFERVNGQPTQQIVSSVELTLAVIDLQSLPKVERDPKVREMVSEMAQQPFDLTVAPLLHVMLLRLAPAEHVLLFVMHHIISDGWSIGVLHRELAVLYDAFVTGNTSPLPELSIQYADFAVWQRSWLEQTALKKQLQYWQQQLANLAVLQLPADFSRPAVQSFRGAVEILELPQNLKQGLMKLSQQHGVTLFMTLLATFKVLLHRYTGQTDIVVGSPIANRNRSEIEPLIGFFVNTLVLRTQIQDHVCFDELLKQLREITLGAYAHQDLPFERLVEELQPERSLNSNPLVQVAFAVQNAPMEELQLTGLQLSRLELEYKTTRLDMEWHVWEQPQGLKVMVAYATDLFAQQTIHRMLGHFQTLLEGIVANPQQRLWKLPMLSAIEHQQLLWQWNDTDTEYPHHKCIHQLFEAQVERSPDAVALVFSGQQLTYQELNVRANQLAHKLQSMGIRPEVLVGLCVERSIEMIVGLLAILKAGGAYVPLDPEYPQQRLAYILSDARVSVVLTQQHLVERLSRHSADLVCLDTDAQAISQQSQENLESGVTPQNLAYVIYTSGSTGLPKGTLVAHSGLSNLASAHIQTFALGNSSHILQFSSLSFDVSTWEVVMALTTGGTLYLGTTNSLRPGKELIELLRQYQITQVFLPPSVLAVLPTSELRALQTMIVGGEACSASLVCQWMNGRKFFHGYGPTETTVCATLLECTISSAKPSIGRPIANTQVYLLDEQLQPVPIGVSGELYISGDGLSRGYLNRPELTASKFIPNPFSDQPGTRLYKTGDKARYLSDGNIEFLGRIDNQVKLRGYRIELGEIESVLNQHPLVAQAVAIVREDSPGLVRIVAYCTQGSSDSLNTNIESTQLPTEHVSQWQTLYDQTYAQTSQESDATFNIVGWNSSYTNQPIPSQQMRQWLDSRVNHILAFQPQRVLEIGCGTGLLLFQIAPHCEHYYGTDFSDVALASIAQQLRHPEWHLPQVQLQQKLADDFEGIEPGSFDTVILNSVVQYFPSIDYLLKVLVGAVKAVAPGGIVFVGDVRSLPLLEAMHASVQLYQAAEDLSTFDLQQRVQTQMAQETELVIDPEFFLALKQHLPQITSVQIRLQRGEYHNELTQFRYDVTLHVGETQPIAQPKQLWHDWQTQGLTLTSTAQLLHSQPEQLGITRIPNARVVSALKTVELLARKESPPSISQMRAAIQSLTSDCGIDPEQLWAMAEQLGYQLAIGWSESEIGCYDVLFWQQSALKVQMPQGGATPLEKKTVPPRAWSSYGNNPLQTQIDRQLQSQLRNYLSARLPEYMVPSAIVMLSSLPLTPNGKVDRKALPAPEASRTHLTESYVAPRSRVEEILVSLWAELLGQQQVGIHDNFFDLGGHSLLATQLISRVRDVLQLELPLRYLFEAPTPAHLAELIAQIQGQNYAVESSAIKPVARNSELPLSFAQARLWFLDQLAPLNPFYNAPFAFRVAGELNVVALQRSLNEIIRRHETLRTSFRRVDGQPMQRIAQTWELTIATIELVDLPQEQRSEETRKQLSQLAQQPFDLTVAPLMRVTLLRLASTEYVLLFVMHHIISDGWSWGVFYRELAVLYETFVTGKTSPLPELNIQYADFAVWQRHWLEQTALKNQLQYWQQQLANLAVLQLPTDYPRPAEQSFRGAIEILELPQNLKQALVKLSQQQGVTLFMTMLSVFKVLLHRYTGQTDIVVGSPVANRNRSEIEPLIGFFANTLVLRTQIQGNMCFEDLLKQVRSVTLGAYAHQDLPFERLVEELQPERHVNANPLFQVLFALQNAPMEELQLTGLQLSRLELEYNTTRLDMEWHVWEQPQGLQIMIAYATDLFAQQTIKRMFGHFQTLIEGIVANCEQQISELPLLKETERQQLLVLSNDVQADTVPGNEEQILAQLDGLSDDEVNALLNQMLVE